MNKSELIEAILSLDPTAKGSRLQRLRKAELELALAALKPALAAPSKKQDRVYKTEAHSKQAESMKFASSIEDRRVARLDEDHRVVGVWDTCCAVWKDEQFTGSQCDRLSNTLLRALREGSDIPVVELRSNGRWTLAAAVGA